MSRVLCRNLMADLHEQSVNLLKQFRIQKAQVVFYGLIVVEMIVPDGMTKKLAYSTVIVHQTM